MLIRKKHIINIVIILCFLIQNIHLFASEKEPIWMFQNTGQFPKNVNYHIDIDQGDFFIDNKGFTFSFFESPKKHNSKKEKKRHCSLSISEDSILKGQTIRTILLNANLSRFNSYGIKSKFYKNFFKKDLLNIRSYGTNIVKFYSIYEGIDLELATTSENFKYTYHIAPFKNVNQIKQEVKGSSGSYIDIDGNLHHKNIFGEIIEKKPKAWNILKDNSIKEIKIEFKLSNNIVTYHFPEGYDNSQPLVIDPELIFSTFTGSTSDNWGFTATNDEEGNLYSAGICFGLGYPTTTGVFDINYHDGEIYQTTNNGTIVNTIPGFDVVISKFSKDGKFLIYSSYLGGKGNETPNSIIVNKKNELYVFGATSSPDFPTKTNAFDVSYNNGSEFKTMDFYFSGSDIFISQFNQAGDKLLASTYLGGSNNDGISKGDLIYNYGDNFRGEINLTQNEEVLIISTTNSADFPLKSPFQNTLYGNNDAIIVKLSPNLDKIIFSSYLGGDGEETGNSIQYNTKSDKIYISGGTTSNEINSIQTKIKNSYNGGMGDGYIGIINNQTFVFESFRYIGTSSYDQVYFVQLDSQLNTYLLGQSEGNIAITKGKYGNPNSGQFITKYNQDLSQFLWSTTIGGQSGFVEISPTAFLVSECNDIFLTGWGSPVNQYEEHAMNSSTLNFPVTDDAIQKKTDGDNFYIAVLDNDGQNLKYGSFFGGVGELGSHVDGGTCRFDKKGGIYHAVCGGCGGKINGFTTTPGVWSEENKSTNCNLAAFKIELNKISAIASADDTVICSEGIIKFTNNSLSADSYEWDFGDSISLEKNPIYKFKKSGKYKIRLIASDSKKCALSDTTYIDITVKDAIKKMDVPITTLCKDSILTLEMAKIENAEYSWKTSSNSTINENKNILAIKITPPMVIYGITKKDCNTIYYDFIFEELSSKLDFERNITLCRGNESEIHTGQVKSIEWKNHPEWKDKNKISYSPLANSTLFFSAKTIDGCLIDDSIHIEVLSPSSKLISFNDTTICFGDSLKITTKYVTDFSITPSEFSKINKLETYIKPNSNNSYFINYNDPCGPKNESFSINVKIPLLKISNDTTICIGDSVLISGTNMKTYNWQNYEFAKIQDKTNELKVSPEYTTEYLLVGKDELGCKDVKKTKVSLYPKTNFKPSIIQNATWQNPAIINVVGENLKSIKWNPSIFLSSDSNFIVNASIYKNQTYSFVIKDNNNCQDSSTIYLDFEGSLYIPNAFYPGSINGNAIFKAIGLNIRDFEMEIYNRWGELVKTINNIDEGWDGMYENQKCPNDVYIWKVKYLTDREEAKEQTGHVSLIR